MSIVFAFGSNMNLRQMFSRCPEAKLLGPALVRNYRLAFGGASARWRGAVATIEPAPGRRCHGLLFEVPQHDLEALDRFEGVPFSYERVEVPVCLARKRPRKAFAYRLRAEAPGAPSAAYVGVLWAAYREWGFDARPLAEAIAAGCDGKDHLRGARELALRIATT